MSKHHKVKVTLALFLSASLFRICRHPSTQSSLHWGSVHVQLGHYTGRISFQLDQPRLANHRSELLRDL